MIAVTKCAVDVSADLQFYICPVVGYVDFLYINCCDCANYTVMLISLHAVRCILCYVCRVL